MCLLAAARLRRSTAVVAGWLRLGVLMVLLGIASVRRRPKLLRDQRLVSLIEIGFGYSGSAGCQMFDARQGFVDLLANMVHM